MWRGFEDLARLRLIAGTPRLAAAEIYGSLAEALRTGAVTPPAATADRPSIAASIATAQSTYQALHALRASRGLAHRVGDVDLVAVQRELAALEGIYAEPSSVAALAAVRDLRARGAIGESDAVVALLTASGLKDPDAAAADAAALPVVAGRLDEFLGALHATYGFRP
jgi:threonine synthase